MKTFAVLCLGVLLSAFKSGAAPEKPMFPMQQTVDGVTVRLERALWCHPSFMGEKDWPTDNYTPGLGVWFEVRSPTMKPAAGKTLAAAVRSIKAVTPWRSVSAARFKKPTLAWCERVDPRASALAVEFEVLDPAAPPGATGEWDAPAQFKDVPLPTKVDVPLKINRTITTPRGTRVVLEQVALRVKEKQMWLTLRALPSLSVPDLETKFVTDKYHYLDVLPVVYDDKGKNLAADLKTSPINQLAGDGDDWHGAVTIKTVLPSAGAKNFAVGVKVHESAPSLKQERWFRHFRFDLPAQHLGFQPGPMSGKGGDWVSKDALDANGKPVVEGTLEAVMPNFGNHQVRFWWRDLNPLRDGSDRYWRIQKISTSEGEMGPNSSYPIYWKLDASPPAPSEYGEAMIFGGQDARRLNFNFTLEAVRTALDTLEFTDLPLPAPGQTEIINQTRTTKMGTRLTLRQISYLQNPKGQKKLPNLSENEVENLRINSDSAATLVLVFDKENNQSVKKMESELSLPKIYDEKGRELSQHWSALGLFTSNRIIFGVLPPVDTHRGIVRFDVRETQVLGPTATIAFEDVAVPKP